ncbi:peptide ABC transporter substrate-binding protein [Spirochaetia bacterium]|nr:peptide ABC transporter substrate-binding protein [Spirochaetia bacterium]
MSKFDKRITVLLGFLALPALVFAGGKKDSQAAGAPKVLNWVSQGEITTMDSGKSYDTLSWEQIEFFNESLFKIDGNNEPVPALAQALPEISADGLTVTVTLREGIRFSDGSPITADDFVYGARRVVDPAVGSQSARRLTYIKNGAEIIAGDQRPETLGIRALAPNKLEINLVAPNPYINWELASVIIAPVSRKFAESKGANYGLSAENLLASGPFVLTGWNGANISWSYVKNPHYWDAKNIYFDEIKIQVVKEVATGVALYEAGSLAGAPVSGEHLSVYRGAPDLVEVQTLRMTNLELGVSSNKALQNINLRKALLLAVNREELATAILNGDGVPAVGAIPNGIAVSPVNGKSIKDDFGTLVKFDAAQARQFLTQALRELSLNQITLRLVTSDNDEGIKVGQYLQSVYETNLPGLKIDLANVPASVRFQEMMSYKFDLALGGWTGEFNPATYPKQFETSNEHNHGKWVSPELTNLINALETTDGTNFALRWDHLRQANQYLIDNAVVVPLVQASKSYLVNPKLKGYVVHVLGTPIDITRAHF